MDTTITAKQVDQWMSAYTLASRMVWARFAHRLSPDACHKITIRYLNRRGWTGPAEIDAAA